MKKLKIKWGNVFKVLIFVFCGGIILHDFYCLAFKFAMFTWFGLFTNLMCWAIMGMIYEDFEEQIEKTSTTRNS